MTRQVVRPIGIGYFIGSALIRGALDTAGPEVLKEHTICGYAKGEGCKHAEYGDLRT